MFLYSTIGLTTVLLLLL